MPRRDEAQPYLGDCLGDPVVYAPIIAPRRRYGWIERGTAAFIGWVGVGAYAFLILIWLVALFASTSRSIGKEIEGRQYRVPVVCKPLAERYGIPDLLTRDEALAALIKLEDNRNWPGVAVCLKSIPWKLK